MQSLIQETWIFRFAAHGCITWVSSLFWPKGPVVDSFTALITMQCRRLFHFTFKATIQIEKRSSAVSGSRRTRWNFLVFECLQIHFFKNFSLCAFMLAFDAISTFVEAMKPFKACYFMKRVSTGAFYTWREFCLGVTIFYQKYLIVLGGCWLRVMGGCVWQDGLIHLSKSVNWRENLTSCVSATFHGRTTGFGTAQIYYVTQAQQCCFHSPRVRKKFIKPVKSVLNHSQTTQLKYSLHFFGTRISDILRDMDSNNFVPNIRLSLLGSTSEFPGFSWILCVFTFFKHQSTETSSCNHEHDFTFGHLNDEILFKATLKDRNPFVKGDGKQTKSTFFSSTFPAH